MKQVSKRFYFLSIPGALGGSMLLAFGYRVFLSPHDNGAPIILLVFSLLIFALLGYGIIHLLRFIYKMWSAIQDGDVRTTPKKAVWFLIIPIFQFYWIFQAVWGWTKDYNQYTTEKNIIAPHIPEGVALAIGILTCCSMIPLLNFFAGILILFLWTTFLDKACDGINAIAIAKEVEGTQMVK